MDMSLVPVILPQSQALLRGPSLSKTSTGPKISKEAWLCQGQQQQLLLPYPWGFTSLPKPGGGAFLGP